MPLIAVYYYINYLEFMRYKVDIFLYSFTEELGKKGKDVGGLIISTSVFNLCSILFGLIAYMRMNKPETPDETSNNDVPKNVELSCAKSSNIDDQSGRNPILYKEQPMTPKNI